MTPDQCRAARELLGWREEELSRRAMRYRGTVRRFESGLRCHPATQAALSAALLRAGIEFGGGQVRRVRPTAAGEE